jgi:tetratricopeptide (TPR) repeat protein
MKHAVSTMLAAVMLASFASAAIAQEPEGEYTRKTCELVERDTRDLAPLSGKKVYMLGKYKQYFSGILKLADNPVKVFVPGEDEELTNAILDLKPSKDNIYVYGLVAEHARHGYVIQVKRIENAPCDLDLFKGRIRETAGDDADALIRIADWGTELADSFNNEELAKIARETHLKAFAMKEKAAGSDAKKLAKLAADYMRALGDKDKALELYRASYKADPKLEAAIQGLKKLGCRLYKGKWVRPGEREFLTAINERRRNKKDIYRLSPDFLKTVTKHGNLSFGMNEKEVAASWGFPEDITKKTVKDDKYVMWSFRNGAFAVFENGLLIKWKKEE